MSELGEVRKFQLLRNGDAEPSELDWNKGIERARQAISEAMNAKNIAFLLGARTAMPTAFRSTVRTQSTSATAWCRAAR